MPVRPAEPRVWSAGIRASAKEMEQRKHTQQRQCREGQQQEKGRMNGQSKAVRVGKPGIREGGGRGEGRGGIEDSVGSGACRTAQTQYLGSKNGVDVFHSRMCDIQAMLANCSSIGIVQTQDGIAVRLKRGQRADSVVSAKGMTKRTLHISEYSRLNHNVTIGKRPNSNIEYRHVAPLILRCLHTPLSEAGWRMTETPQTTRKKEKNGSRRTT
jgi:hypothetical protein